MVLPFYKGGDRGDWRGMSAKTLFDLLSYAAFRVFLRVLAILPLSVAACAGAFLGAAVFALGIRKGLLRGI